jgi:hypothetical protein
MIRGVTAIRPDGLEEFLSAWFGPPLDDPGPAPEGPYDIIPGALRKFYGLMSGWPGLFKQNELLGPNELSQAEGRIVFYVENQGVFAWATEPSGEDPPVWGRWNEPGEEWQREEEPLSRFLIQAVLFEATLQAPFRASAAWLEPDELARALDPLEPLPYGAWRWPGYPTRFHGAQDIVAVVMPNTTEEDDSSSSMFVGARTDEAIAFLEDVVDDSWEYYSLGDA